MGVWGDGGRVGLDLDVGCRGCNGHRGDCGSDVLRRTSTGCVEVFSLGLGDFGGFGKFETFLQSYYSWFVGFQYIDTIGNLHTDHFSLAPAIFSTHGHLQVVLFCSFVFVLNSCFYIFIGCLLSTYMLHTTTLFGNSQCDLICCIQWDVHPILRIILISAR